MPKASSSAKKKATTKASKPAVKKTTTAKKPTKTLVEKVPVKKTVTKKTSVKKTAVIKKTSVRKAVAPKKTPVKKTTIKKSPIKEAATKKLPKKGGPKIKPVFVDVITDDETEAVFDRAVYRPDYEEQDLDDIQSEALDFAPIDNEPFDKQKKFFSELMEESQGLNLDPLSEKPDEPLLRKKPLKLYHRQAWGYLAATLILLVAIFYFFAVKLTVLIYPQGAEIINDSTTFVVTSASELDSNYPLVRGEAKIVEKIAEKVYQVEQDGEVDELSGRVRGTVTLVNKLTRNQRLVATTRLLTADGRLYRLDQAVNIPAGGELEASVYADELGKDKLLISSEKLTLPGLWEGLQNSVYAESGEFYYQADIKTIISQTDLDRAEADLEEVLDAKAKNDFRPAAGQATTYKDVPGSFEVQFSAKAGSLGTEFTATAKKSYGLVRFSKEDAINLAKNRLAAVISDDRRLTGFNPDSVVFSLDDYKSNPSQATVTATFSGLMTINGKDIPVNAQKLTALKEDQIKDHLNQIPELRDYELKFWPSFIKRAPHLPDRITVELAE